MNFKQINGCQMIKIIFINKEETIKFLHQELRKCCVHKTVLNTSGKQMTDIKLS